MFRFIAPLLRWYLLHAPVQKGKGLVHRWLRDHLGRRPFVLPLNEGFRIEIRHIPGDETALWYYLYRTWEEATTASLCKVLRPGDTFVDVGANIGFYSLLAASQVGPQGRVIAFEPGPPTFAWLSRNCELNGYLNIDLRQEAVSIEPGYLHWQLPQDEWLAMARTVAASSDASSAVKVVATSLDVLLKELPAAPLVVKVDVEGGERDVFAGAERLLDEGRPILLFELSPVLAERTGWQAEDLLAQLTHSFQYQYFVPAAQGKLCPIASLPEVLAQGRKCGLELFAFSAACPWHQERLASLLSVKPEA